MAAPLAPLHLQVLKCQKIPCCKHNVFTSIGVCDTIKYTSGILTLLASTLIRSAIEGFLINQGWTSICALLGVPSIGETVKDVMVCLSSDSFYTYIYSE